jgi:hypothetical protein
LSLLTALYVFVLSSVFTAFRCLPQDDGSFSLISSPSLDCYDSVWFDHFWIIFLSILIVFAVPTALSVILYKSRFQRYSNTFQWKFGTLISHYKPQFYYWEVVSLLFKTIFVCLVDLTNGWDKFERAFALILFFTVQMYLDAVLKPYQEMRIPVSEIRLIFQLISIFLVLTDALVYRDSLSLINEATVAFLDWGIVIFIVCAFLYMNLRVFLIRSKYMRP